MRRLLTVFVAAFLIVAGAGIARAQEGAKEFVNHLGQEAVSALADTNLSEAQRQERFRGMLQRYFDMPSISKFVLGRHWKTMSPPEQEEFQGLFETFVVQVYTSRFSTYSGEQFMANDARDDGDGMTVVQSIIANPTSSGDQIRVDWRVAKRDQGYKIIDVAVEGVSMTITQRSEFSSIIQNNGGKVQALIDILRKKTVAAAPKNG